MSDGVMQSRKITFVEISEAGADFFEQALQGHDLEFVDRMSDVREDVEILSTFVHQPVDQAFIESRPCLGLIAVRSTSFDHIDVETCRRRGVAVCNVGSYGENTVAEHAFALMLALARKLRDSDQAVHTGRFNQDHLRGFDLRGKTLGVVGAGRVGLHAIRIASGFGMKVLAYDSNPHPFYSELLDFQYVSFDRLMKESRVITLHVPLNDSTRHLINRESLALCQDGLLLINTARGGLIDTAAAIEGLESGRIGGMGLDVLEDERVFRSSTSTLMGQQIAERVRSADSLSSSEAAAARLAEFSRLVAHSNLLKRPNVILTPHVAYNSEEAAQRLRSTTLETIRDYMSDKPLTHNCI
jgi:D-lactate dehydrogenase